MPILIDNYKNGWQNTVAHELMNNDAVYVCKDLSLDIYGSLRCRNLNIENSYFSTLTNTTEINNLYQLDVEGAGKRLIFHSADGGLYVWNSATGVSTTISNSVVSNRHFSYAAMQPSLSATTYVFMTDGVVQAMHNGTVLKTWGIDSPESSVRTVLSESAGDLSGSYRYMYTFYDAATGSESDPSPTNAAITVSANSAIDVSGIAKSTASRVTSRRLYRTVTGGGTYYLVATISDNVTTAFTDTIADASLSVPAVIDQGIPPSGRLVTTYKDILFISGNRNYPNRVYFSLTKKPDNFPSTYYIDVGTSDDEVVAFAQLEGMLYFVLTAGISRLYGSTADTFYADNTRSHVGTYAPLSVAEGPDGVYFLSHDGVYRFDGVKAVKVSEQLRRIFDRTPTSLYDVVDTNTAGLKATGVCLNGVYYLVVPMKSTTGTITNKVISYDVADQVWLRNELAVNDIFADAGRGELYISMEDTQNSGEYMVYNALSYEASSVDSPSIEMTTKSFSVLEASDYAITETGVKARTPRGAVGWIRKFRLDADGDWTIEFFLDGKSVYSVELTGLSMGSRHKWYGLPDNLKGRFVYVTLTSGGTPRPDSHIIRGIEIR